MSVEIVILGAGPAGYHAARAARSAGRDVLLAGAEPYGPYWRPRLPEMIHAEGAVDTILMQKNEWFSSSGIRLLTSKRAAGIDPSNKSVQWEDGGSTEYGALILACGADARVPSVPFAEKVHPLRTYENVRDIRGECGRKRRAFIVGGGILGLEAAYAVTRLGIPVSVYDIHEYPLSRQLDREGGLFLKKLLEARGIRILSGESLDGFRDEIERSCVIAAAGVLPSVGLAEKCGIRVNRGILVDSHMRTSARDIYACGDVAEFSGAVPGLLPVAAKQGETAGLNAAGGNVVYRPVLPSPMTRLADLSILSVGSVGAAEGTRFYRRFDGTNYAMAAVTSGKITGGAWIGDIAPGLRIKKRMESGGAVGDVSSYEEIEKALERE